MADRFSPESWFYFIFCVNHLIQIFLGCETSRLSFLHLCGNLLGYTSALVYEVAFSQSKVPLY